MWKGLAWVQGARCEAPKVACLVLGSRSRLVVDLLLLSILTDEAFKNSAQEWRGVGESKRLVQNKFVLRALVCVFHDNVSRTQPALGSPVPAAPAPRTHPVL